MAICRCTIILSLWTLLGVAGALQSADDARFLKPAVRIRYERIEQGAVITGHGTAFGVDLSAFGLPGKKYLLSAAHNVLDDRNNPYATLKIEIIDGTRTYWSTCTVVAADQNLDLCLLEAGDAPPALAVLAQDDALPGTPLVLAGSPRGIPVALFKGDILRRFDNGTIRSLARVKFDHGDSGGPVYCANTGKVIGVAVAGVPKNGDLDHEVGLFVPSVGVHSFLEARCRAKLDRPRPVVAQAAKTIKAAPQIEELPPVAPVAMSAPAPRPAAQRSGDFVPAEVPGRVPAVSKEITVPKAPAPVVATAPKPVLPAPQAETIALKLDKPVLYVVQEGDYLGKIAKKHNSSIKAILAANEISNPNLLTIGMKLVIP